MSFRFGDLYEKGCGGATLSTSFSFTHQKVT